MKIVIICQKFYLLLRFMNNLKKILNKYSLKSFNNKKKVFDYFQCFDLHKLVNEEDKKKGIKPCGPDFNDLARLHYLVLLRKPFNVLEFGSGYSSLVMSHAMNLLYETFYNFVKKNFSIDNPFKVYSVEEDKYFQKVSSNRIKNPYRKRSVIFQSNIRLDLYNGKFATFYESLPNILPDLIYVDGPAPLYCKNSIDGFSMNSNLRMPMSADILRFEFFLEPGALIVFDGRSANAKFFKAQTQRCWKHLYDSIGDVHIFELNEKSLGPKNKKKLEFCIENNFLIK